MKICRNFVKILQKMLEFGEKYRQFAKIPELSSNQRLRQALETMTGSQQAKVFYARPEYCTDNGAMIALAGALRLQAGHREPLAVNVKPRWPLTELEPMQSSV